MKQTKLFIVLLALIAVVASSGCTLHLAKKTETVESASTDLEWHPPKHYQFVSISQRFFERYPAKEASAYVCMIKKVTGLDPDQNPLVSVYIDEKGDKTYFYISEIIVGEPYLSLHNWSTTISNDYLDSIIKKCKERR